jgi:hypothetical protein
MNIIYYLLGAFITIVLTVLYSVIISGSFLLNQPTLIDLAIRASIAAVAFITAEYIMRKKAS